MVFMATAAMVTVGIMVAVDASVGYYDTEWLGSILRPMHAVCTVWEQTLKITDWQEETLMRTTRS